MRLPDVAEQVGRYDGEAAREANDRFEPRVPGYVMDQMGHTDPTFTLRVYRKAMKRRDSEPDLLRALVGAEASTLADLHHRAARHVPEEAPNV